MDSSIIFESNDIEAIIDYSKDIGLLTRYLDLKLPCYTDPRMFNWFGTNENQFHNVHTLEANFIVLNRNLLTELIMKAWVTCALDAECIAPKFAHIYGNVRNWFQGCHVCGCHRFDQDALSIVSTFFFAHPIDFNYKPAYALTSSEMNSFQVKRRDVLTFVSDQIKNHFRTK